MHSRSTPRAVLFDLDDTLFDHQQAAQAALAAVHAGHDCFSLWSFYDFERTHARFLEELHDQVIAGVMSIDDARVERFRRLFAASGVRADHGQLQSMAAAYRGTYLAARRPVDGARELLSALKPRVQIGIVSNNLLDEQQEKLRLCGFEPYVDALVVSEEAGVSKPDPAIFRRALERLDCEPVDAVMIGDSWAADIQGARAAGIRPIWFNRTGRLLPESPEGVIELRALTPHEPVIAAIFGDTQAGQSPSSVPVDCPA